MNADPQPQDADLTLDLIDIPYWLSFHADDETWKVSVYKQRSIYTKDENLSLETGNLSVDRASGEGRGGAHEKAIGDNLGAFFQACRNLSCFIREKGLEPLCAGLDPEKAGILLTEQNGELSWKVVSGKERPDLMVENWFGGPEKTRPYQDELLDGMMQENQSLEEKTEAAEAGDIPLMKELAMLYLDGDDDQEIEPDAEKAVYWFQKAAEAGDEEAMFNLGLHYAKGHGTERDFQLAAEWMDKAAEAGDEDAENCAAQYREIAASIPLAEAGDAAAQALLAQRFMELGGSLYQAGEGDDYAESVKWARLASAQGNGDAFWTLGLAYEHGRGVDADDDAAVDCYRQGAKLGNAACQHSLACYYGRGDHLEQDNRKAFELCKKAAEQGYGLAMRDLGRCYQFGLGCMGNMKTALEWYKKAADVLDDPELDQRVMLLSHMEDALPDWGEDYPGEDSPDDEEDS